MKRGTNNAASDSVGLAFGFANSPGERPRRLQEENTDSSQVKITEGRYLHPGNIAGNITRIKFGENYSKHDKTDKKVIQSQQENTTTHRLSVHKENIHQIFPQREYENYQTPNSSSLPLNLSALMEKLDLSSNGVIHDQCKSSAAQGTVYPGSHALAEHSVFKLSTYPPSKHVKPVSFQTHSNPVLNSYDIIDSDELFGEGKEMESVFTSSKHEPSQFTASKQESSQFTSSKQEPSQFTPSRQEPNDFTVSEPELITARNPLYEVLSEKCKTGSCSRKCVRRTYPYCMTCFEELHVQPKPLKDFSGKVDVVPVLKTMENPLPVVESDEKDTETHQDLGAPASNVQTEPNSQSPDGRSVQDGCCAVMSPAVKRSGETTAELQESLEVEAGRKKCVSIKPVTCDPCDIECDVIICLWSKCSIDAGDQFTVEHPVLSKFGTVIEDMVTFQSFLLLGMVHETDGGKSKAGSIVHCKYDLVVDHLIANTLLRCIRYTESKKNTSIVIPLDCCDELRRKPETVMRAVMYVISNIQKTTKYSQNLKKIYLCVDSAGDVERCKMQFKSIKKKPLPQCCKCDINKAVRLKPLSDHCTEECCLFCVQCLKYGRQDGLNCPQHGQCLSPIGHTKTYALVVAGFHVSSIFIKEANRMARFFKSEDYIGVSERNVQVITAKQGESGESLRERIKSSFCELRRQLKRDHDNTDHSFVFFYYTGHNNEKGLKLSPNDVMTPMELKSELRKLKVDSILVILDCCYSGAVRLTEHFNSEDFTTSLTSYSITSCEGLDSLMFLPKLWNLEEQVPSGGQIKQSGRKTKVYQWSSCIAEEKSYVQEKRSLFTDAIVQTVKGVSCPCGEAECEMCRDFKSRTVKNGGIFLNQLHESVEYHVSSRAQLKDNQQHPQLDSIDKENMLFAFHDFSCQDC